MNETVDLFVDAFDQFSPDDKLSTVRSIPPIINLKFQHSNSIQDSDSEITSLHDASIDAYSINRSILISITKFMINTIAFQLRLLSSIFTLPALILYYVFSLVTSPFQTVRFAVDYFAGILTGMPGFVFHLLSPFASRWSNEYKAGLKLVLRFGWGFIWSAYVCIVLVGLFLSSFLMSGFTMGRLVDEPLLMKKALYFDYTKNSPVANFPVTSCPGGPQSLSYGEKLEVAKSGSFRVIPRNHKFQVTVSLTLPESDYNRNLGIFQVRVDCLSANGIVIGTSKHPCMLPFKSQPIRHVLTFLKIAPLLTGYITESQILTFKIRDFTEGDIPTACVQVLIEPRAEYRVGAGIPEIYDASMLLKSDLPFHKRILWHWKKTAFIWMSMTFFMTGLLFTLICCTHVLLPKPRQPHDSGTFQQ